MVALSQFEQTNPHLVNPQRSRLHNEAAAKSAKLLKQKDVKQVRKGAFTSRAKLYRRQVWRIVDWPNGDQLILMADGKLMISKGQAAVEVTVPFDALRQIFSVHVQLAWWKVNR